MAEFTNPYIYSSGDFELGDYVIVDLYGIDNSVHDKAVVKINSLSNRKIGFINPKTGHQNYVRTSEKRIHPIPLSDEYLPHFGFKKTNGPYWCLIFHWKADVCIFDTGVLISGHIINCEKKDLYIHNIQHLINFFPETKPYKKYFNYESTN